MSVKSSLILKTKKRKGKKIVVAVVKVQNHGKGLLSNGSNAVAKDNGKVV